MEIKIIGIFHANEYIKINEIKQKINESHAIMCVDYDYNNLRLKRIGTTIIAESEFSDVCDFDLKQTIKKIDEQYNNETFKHSIIEFEYEIETAHEFTEYTLNK